MLVAPVTPARSRLSQLLLWTGLSIGVAIVGLAVAGLVKLVTSGSENEFGIAYLVGAFIYFAIGGPLSLLCGVALYRRARHKRAASSVGSS
jgi:hypothetical protein